MLTEAGRKWLNQAMADSDYLPKYGQMATAIAFGIRLFCDEVEKRASSGLSDMTLCELHGSYCNTRTGHAFDELKRELVSDSEPSQDSAPS